MTNELKHLLSQTKALDSTTEKEITEAFGMLSRDRTTIVIAHRLSSIVDADEIFVFEAGAIAEHGSHVQLLSKGGLYASMWQNQQAEQQSEQQPTMTATS